MKELTLSRLVHRIAACEHTPFRVRFHSPTAGRRRAGNGAEPNIGPSLGYVARAS
jgi:hypothetical protein